MNAALWLCAALLGCLICGGAALAEEPALAATDGTGRPQQREVTAVPRGVPPAAVEGVPAAAETGAPALIDLNRAGVAELTTLPGIGQKRAEAILAFRSAHGGFHSVSQLLQIKGIGRAMLRRLRLLVTISSLGADAQDARVAAQAGTRGGGTPPPHRVR
ncbi:MAG TPA: helix-hairpin-helix domain-containing protein [Polyangiales bacterium]